MAQQNQTKGKGPERDIFLEAPPQPRKGLGYYLFIIGFLLVLGWALKGSKIRPAELVQGIPQIVTTLGRMLPPDFSKVVDAESYYIPA